MDKEEIKKCFKEDGELMLKFDILSNIAVIKSILIAREMIEQDKLEKIVEETKEQYIEKRINMMTEEEIQALEASKKFNDLFGKI